MKKISNSIFICYEFKKGQSSLSPVNARNCMNITQVLLIIYYDYYISITYYILRKY